MSACLLHGLVRGEIASNRVRNVQQVTHLFAVSTSDGKAVVRVLNRIQCLPAKPADPALVKG